MANPGCCGTAARLPKKPGTQKLTPPLHRPWLGTADRQRPPPTPATLSRHSSNPRRPLQISGTNRVRLALRRPFQKGLMVGASAMQKPENNRRKLEFNRTWRNDTKHAARLLPGSHAGLCGQFQLTFRDYRGRERPAIAARTDARRRSGMQFGFRAHLGLN
jgi:hypothetical protein